MALTLKTAATLRKLQNRPNIGKVERRPFDKATEADADLSKALDSFFPSLDETPSDGAAGQEGLLRYHTSKGENIQVIFEGDSKSGNYVQEWAGGGFIYTTFQENSIDNYQVGPQGANHLHLDRADPSKSYVEVSPKGFDFLTTEDAPAAPPKVEPDQMIEKDGIQYAVLREGASSEKADRGESVLMNYTGWLENGETFDSSLNRKKPFRFALGQGQVIQGWEKGVEGMAVGEKRLLEIPSHLAYGDRARGTIPANAPLTFEVELLATDGELVKP